MKLMRHTTIVCILLIAGTSVNLYAQDATVLNKPPLVPTERPLLRKVEPLKPIGSDQQSVTEKQSTKRVSEDGWTDFASTKIYPDIKEGKVADWYVLTIAPDFSSMSFVNKNQIERKGDAVQFDAWRFESTPVKGKLFDSTVMTISLNCKSMKGKFVRVSLLRGNRVISEKSLNHDGFLEGSEGYVMGQEVCNDKYIMPMPAQPDADGIRKILEGLKK